MVISMPATIPRRDPLKVLAEIRKARAQFVQPPAASDADDANLSYVEWIERNLHIQTEAGDVLPLALTSAQRKIYDAWDAAKAANDGLLRLVILKCRRIRASTAVAARFFERGIRSGLHGCALTLVSDDDVRITLDGMMRRFHRDWPGAPAPEYSRRGYEIVFPPPIDFRFTCQIADAYSGTAAAIHLLHATEVAKWRKARETAGSLASATRMADQVWESTANGQTGHGEYFYHLWQRAERGENGFYPLFIPWYEHEEYRIPASDTRFERVMDTPVGDEEASLQVAHRLTDEQMAWRRWVISDEFGGDTDWFRQEFPSHPSEAFLRVEGRRVFDLGACSSHRAIAERFNADSPPIVGRLEWATKPILDHTGRCVNRDKLSVRFAADEHGPLRIWIPPDAEGPHIRYRYIGAGDVAKGVEGGDSNSGAILDRQQRVICAAWHELCDATLFGEYMARLAVFYDAEIAIEVNGVGHSALVKLLEIAGPRYTWATHKFQPGNPVSEWDRGKWGWTTSDRHYMAEGLRDVIRENRWIDPDIEAWGEIMGIVHEASGRPAFSGRDRTMARAILARVDEMAPPVRMPEEEQPQRRDYSDWRAKQAREERKWQSGGSADWRTRGITARVPGGDHRLIVGRKP